MSGRLCGGMLAIALVLGCTRAHAQPVDVAAELKKLHDGDGAAKVLAADRLGSARSAAKEIVPALTAALDSSDSELRWHAARSLGMLGHASAPAVEKLNKQLGDSHPLARAYAAFALGRIGSESIPALPALVAALEDSDATVRRLAMRAIATIKPPSNVVLPIFIDVFKKSDPTLILPALHSMAEAGDEAMPLVLEAMKDPRARYWGCVILASMGPKAKPALDSLVSAIDDADRGVRREAILALGEIGPDASPAVPSLVKALADRDSSIRAGAAFALGKIGPDADAALKPLHACLDDADPLMRVVAVWALVRIEPSDKALRKKAVPILVEALKHTSGQVRGAAAHALADLRTGDTMVIPAFVAALKDPEASVADVACDALADLGEPAVLPLSKALSDSQTRGLAALALARIGRRAQAAVPALVQALGDSHATTRREVLIALAAIGPGAAKAAPAVAELLEKDSDLGVKQTAAYALGQLGLERVSVDALLRGLTSSRLSVGVACGWALAQLHPADDQVARLAMPVLAEGLKSDKEATRVQAAAGLGSFGLRATGEIPGLNHALNDEDEGVRRAAAEAIERIQH